MAGNQSNEPSDRGMTALMLEISIPRRSASSFAYQLVSGVQ